MKSLVAIYPDVREARAANEALVEHGVPADLISVAVRASAPDVEDLPGEPMPMVIRGIGPAFGTGPFARAIRAGGIQEVGGLIDALIGWGVPHREARLYAGALRAGDVLLAVDVEEQDTAAVDALLESRNRLDIEAEAERWLEERAARA